MRAKWHALHVELERSAHRYVSHQHFLGIRQRHRDLRPFREHGALLGFLHGRTDNPARKNAILRDLVTSAQGRRPSAETAQVLVLLALWPGLDAVRGRLLRHFRTDPERLTAELVGRLTEAIATIELAGVERLAATLLRNLERDLRRMIRKEWARAHDAEMDDNVVDQGAGRADQSYALLARDLDRTIGPDTDLVVAICLFGMTQKEAGQALGLGHDAARKRYQRAARKLRVAYAQ